MYQKHQSSYEILKEKFFYNPTKISKKKFASQMNPGPNHFPKFFPVRFKLVIYIYLIDT